MTENRNCSKFQLDVFTAVCNVLSTRVYMQRIEQFSTNDDDEFAFTSLNN